LAARRLFFGWRRRQTIPAGGASRRLRGLVVYYQLLLTVCR